MAPVDISLGAVTPIKTTNQVLATATPGTTANTALWVLQVLMAAAFVAAGSGKLFVSAERAALFDAAFGTGPWFRYLTGSLELLGALLLLVPGKIAYGAVLLACVMVGAVVAHLAVLHTPPTSALFLLVVVALIAWGRRRQFAGLFRS
jgi:putative oxidoreductase